MNPIFQYSRYTLHRQVLALTGKVRVFSPEGTLLLFAEQKMFKLKEELHVFADESKAHEVLTIRARQVLDWAATYDVYDAVNGQKLGAWRRKGVRSMLRDQWDLLDVQDQPVGLLFEDTIGLALLRRFLLGALLPQNYDLTIGEQRVGDLRQRFHLFRYILDLDFSMDTAGLLDRRMGIAAGILLAIIEGKQEG